MLAELSIDITLSLSPLLPLFFPLSPFPPPSPSISYPPLSLPSLPLQEIQEVAQNILSFLKSNCTIEGHTYWLFRPKGDEVVKLYDLTSLLEETGAKETVRYEYEFMID